MFIKKLNNLSQFNFVILLSFATLLLWFSFLGFKIIDQPYVWDDLYHIRSFSLSEIIHSWRDNWFQHDIETPSYRPIAILFYGFLGTVFGESIILLRLFIFFLMFVLISIFYLSLTKIGFNRLELFFLSLLICFAKIFATLLSWLTISALIFCYILAAASVFLLLKWQEKKETKLYFASLIFCFLSIFTREEMYVFPGIVFLLLIFKQNTFFRNFKNNFLITLPYLLIVILHFFLRKTLVGESQQFEFVLWNLKFGGEEIGFGNMIKAIKSSLLPMGYWSSKNVYIEQSLPVFFWLCSLIICFYINIKFRKFLKLKWKKLVIFLCLVFLLCLQNVAVPRAFGVMLSTLVIISFISFLLSNLYRIYNSERKKLLLRKFNILIIIIILFSGISGGYFRSIEHIKSMNVYSYSIVYYDSMTVYEHYKKDIRIPKVRYINKKKHLEDLNIFSMEDIKNNSKIPSNKIKITKYKPLSF